MFDDTDPRDDASCDPTVDRIANVLRSPERFDDAFETSLVAELRAERPVRRSVRARPWLPAWWIAPADFRFAPLTGLVMAGILTAIVAGATVRIMGRTPPLAPAPSVVATRTIHDTVTYVRFVFAARASSVSLVGDFNEWGSEPLPLVESKNGVWTASVPLTN